jgi:hypothetical protein
MECSIKIKIRKLTVFPGNRNCILAQQPKTSKLVRTVDNFKETKSFTFSVTLSNIIKTLHFMQLKHSLTYVTSKFINLGTRITSDTSITLEDVWDTSFPSGGTFKIIETSAYSAKTCSQKKPVLILLLQYSW